MEDRTWSLVVGDRGKNAVCLCSTLLFFLILVTENYVGDLGIRVNDRAEFSSSSTFGSRPVQTTVKPAVSGNTSKP